MDFFMKLPRRKREFAIFMAIISVISVNIIAPVITCYECGFTLATWANTMKAVPFVWLSVIAIVLLTYKPAEFLTNLIVDENDSFHARITINILCTVFLMSILLTVIGTWIGTGRVSADPIKLFFYKWPRNFAISFAVEALIAQPIARRVMLFMHVKMDAEKAAA
jgi:hypothetical protein